MTTLLLLLSCKGPSAPEDAGAPSIRVVPDLVDFGAVALGDSAQQEVTLTNTGSAALELRDLRLDDGDRGFALSSLDATVLDPQGVATFTVTWSPTSVEGVEETAWIGSNAPEASMYAVTLTGAGHAALVAEPDSHDFGAPFVGCEEVLAVQLRNDSGRELSIEGVELASASGAFTLEAAAALPWTLAPGQFVDVYVDYSPTAAGADEALLSITSPDGVLQVPLVAEPVVYQEHADRFVQLAAPTVDVIVALDASAGMEDEAAAFRSAISTLFNAFDALGADWRLAVVTDDDGCVNGAQPWIDASLSVEERAGLIETMVFQASPGTYAEAGFTLLEAALSDDNTGEGDCNNGLIREEAALALVGVTDFVESSPNDWAHYVSLFEALKPNPDAVVVHAFAGDYPSGCGTADPGLGWYEATVATRGQLLSVCETDWTAHMLTLAAAATPDLSRLSLSAWPVPATIAVAVDGVPTPTGWVHDESDNAIVFDDGVLGAGAVVDVTYLGKGPCAR